MTTRDSVAIASAPISVWQALALSAPSVGFVFLYGPLGIMAGIYAKYFGLTMTSIAVVLFVGRFFDAITDPLAGYFSDRHREKTGTRKPYVLLGGLGLIPCAYFLFVPPEGVSLLYFTFWSLAFYLAVTIYTISHQAWQGELTLDPTARTRLFVILGIVAQLSGLLFAAVPYLPIFETREFTPEVLKVIVLIGGCLMLLGLYLALNRVSNGAILAERNSQSMSYKEVLKLFYRLLRHNQPFYIFVIIFTFMGLAGGMFSGLLFIYVDVFLGLGEAFAKLLMIGSVAAALSTLLSDSLVRKLGKKKAWILAVFAMLCSFFYAGLLGPGALFRDLLIFQLLLVFGGAISVVVSMVALNDTIDFGLLKDDVEQRGVYTSISFTLSKVQVALGTGLGFGLAGWLGFDATATVHDEQASFAIRLAFSWVPAVIMSFALIFIWFMPLDERRCAIIKRRLDQRAQRLANTESSSSISFVKPEVINSRALSNTKKPSIHIV